MCSTCIEEPLELHQVCHMYHVMHNGLVRTRAQGVPVLVQEPVAGVEDVSGIVAHCEVQGRDARVVPKALVRLQLLPQLLAKCRVCGLHSTIPASGILPAFQRSRLNWVPYPQQALSALSDWSVSSGRKELSGY